MKKLLLIAALTVFGTAACTDQVPDAVKDDQSAAADQLDRLNTAQPVPSYSYSQIRQNLIELTTAQAEATQTTSFFFNMGVPNPIAVCPSIGFPIPTTAQLTNPDQAVRIREGATSIAQVEQTGIYTGDSTGTYVICVDSAGDAYADYWEGFVKTVTGPAIWNEETGQVELIGKPSFDFSEGDN